jgi:hypothetical protein
MRLAMRWILAVLLIPSAAAGQTLLQVDPDATYFHEPTGMAFPTAVDHFRRTDIIDYSTNGTDVSAGYRLGDIYVTVYIYPSPAVPAAEDRPAAQASLCMAEFEEVKRIISRHPGAQLVEEGAVPSPSAHHPRAGLRAVYALDAIGNAAPRPLRSEADLYCYVNDVWQIKFRATAPADLSYVPALSDLMHALAWPLPASKASDADRKPGGPRR